MILNENKIIIGENDELFQRALYASNVNLMSRASLDEPGASDRQDTLRPQSSTVHSQTVAGWKALCVCFDEPQRAITPGQAVVLYDGDLVAGGGIIEKIAPELDDAS
ncbi:MAG: aminomethyltransferase beta-barrel domain-containing protein [Coprococcus sp.]